MHTRLLQIIDYKCSGKQKVFAELMGWSPQYMNRLVTGVGSIGLNPVETIIRNIPEINARWFITGEGDMFNTPSADYIFTLLSLERYIPVMTPSEQEQLASGCKFDTDTLNRWENALQERTSALARIFAQAYNKQRNSDKLCNTQTAF